MRRTAAKGCGVRLPRGVGVKLVLLVCLLGLGGFLAATAVGTHDAGHPFAGSWTTSYTQEPASGTIKFRFVGDEEGKAAFAAFPAAVLAYSLGPCAEPSDYYVGAYTRGSDTGRYAGCTVEGGTIVRFEFVSDGFGVNGVFGHGNATLSSSARSWTGVLGRQRRRSELLEWHVREPFRRRRLRGHDSRLGHDDGGASTDEEQPCRALGAGGGDSSCEPPPKCQGDTATIYPDPDVWVPGSPLFGTAGDDVIVGSNLDELIAGGGGDDKICGRGGGDTINGGGGADRISGGGGGDALNSAGGDDSSKGGEGKDLLWGEGGSDTLRYTPFDFEVDGGRGIDRCISSDKDFRGEVVDVTGCGAAPESD